MLVLASMASMATVTAGVHSVGDEDPQNKTARALVLGSDFGLIRREALAEYPIGSKVGDVAQAMEALGFTCHYHPHLIENTTAPTATCTSDGRTVKPMPRLNLVLVARNGTLTDVVISNGLDGLEASAATPDPNPGGQTPVITTAPPEPDPEWDAILAEAKRRHPGGPARAGS